ncbi:hypothetical protein CDD83_10375 [Cordyceps sp. RAO-2017]|nr:hypothetical protein CDD83_10375 [Cordyceps sp. RAO-2017]
MASHHEPFKALGLVDWADVPQDGLPDFLGAVLTDAQAVVDSIPSPTPPKEMPTMGRARAKTDPTAMTADLPPTPSPQRAASEQLRTEWKEAKVNPRDNPLGIRVYKLPGKDGQGSWFARRSVHHQLTFDQWKTGLETEFPETMKVQGAPGSGNIRGIGAEKRVEHQPVDGVGQLNVYQLSAQFPGPTAPRDFVTLFLTSDLSSQPSDHASPLRQFMVVSKPCTHPDCPPRQGFIRGQYESVEVIREIPDDSLANKRSFSHADLTSEEGRRSSGNPRTSASPTSPLYETPRRAVEWLMVTRSDPGGSVPRFLIDKGTPPGIVGDANKFLDWATKTTAEETSDQQQSTPATSLDAEPPVLDSWSKAMTEERPVQMVANDRREVGEEEWNPGDSNGPYPTSNGLWGIITGAFGVATSVAYGLRQQITGPLGLNSSSSSQDSLTEGRPQLPPRPHHHHHHRRRSESDASSVRSFASAVERSMTGEFGHGDSLTESNSDGSRSQVKLAEEKELQKLDERRQRLEHDYYKMQERIETKRQGGVDKDAAALAKAREKHEKELAKHEAKFKREMKRLEGKREQQARKAELRRRKTLEKEEKSNLALELEKVKAERDVALKKAQLLQKQVGELQAQNTMLVAKLGRGGALSRSASTSSRDLSMANRSKT